MNINFPSPAQEGDIYTFDNKTWRFTSGGWSPVGTFMNVTGPTGSTGATGSLADAVTVNSLTVTETLTVQNTASIVGSVATVANTAETTIATFSSAAFRSAKLVVQVKDTVTNQSQISELLLTHNTVDVFATEYGVVHSSANALATFDVYLISNTISLTAERDTSNSTEYKTYLTMMLT
jgi:hypothetical protein